MASVTGRIKQIKQPRGGYIKPKEFTKIIIEDSIKLNEKENIHSTLIGMAVDYMTRFTNGTFLEEAFRISLKGASIAGESAYAGSLISEIKGLDDNSIRNACKLVGYDTCFRAGIATYKPVQEINPDSDTINNVRIMVERSMKFIKNYGPITADGFNFRGGYTDLITSGDGDFLTESTLWDFKVSVKDPTNAHTLQLLIYYLMGMNSVNKEAFRKIENLGVFNPRLNTVYLLEANKISEDIIKDVSEKVIGY
ncbi:MAG: hypothetical protein ACRDDY_08720 [Clostridium sp.]|uniref:hypothetical protein n=1 Tax=Clostridium sp. TaxID=1506 RepID=UPI003EE61086